MTHEREHYELEISLDDLNEKVGRDLGTKIVWAYDGLIIPLCYQIDIQ